MCVELATDLEAYNIKKKWKIRYFGISAGVMYMLHTDTGPIYVPALVLYCY
jgi:hypothetical protein